jgi:hypothetical protein
MKDEDIDLHNKLDERPKYRITVSMQGAGEY